MIGDVCVVVVVRFWCGGRVGGGWIWVDDCVGCGVGDGEFVGILCDWRDVWVWWVWWCWWGWWW